MERFPAEAIYVLVFLGIILFNVVQALRRRQQQAQAEAPAQPEPPPAEDEPLEDVWGRTPALAPAPAPVIVARPAPPPVTRAEPPPPRRLHPVRALLKDRHDLRRAVVLMMVLGPCRSQEPPERR